MTPFFPVRPPVTITRLPQVGEVKVTNMSTEVGDVHLREGEFFGERALLTKETRAADVFAHTGCTVLALDAETFNAVLGPLHDIMKSHFNLNILGQVPPLKKLTEAELKQLNSMLKPMTVKAKEKFLKKDDIVSSLFFVSSGTGALLGDGVAGADPKEDTRNLLMDGEWNPNRKQLEAGSFFCEMCLLQDEVITFDAVAEEELELLELERSAVTELIGPLHRLIIQRGEKETEEKGKQVRWSYRTRPDVDFEDLREVAKLGQGTFGVSNHSLQPFLRLFTWLLAEHILESHTAPPPSPLRAADEPLTSR